MAGDKTKISDKKMADKKPSSRKKAVTTFASKKSVSEKRGSEKTTDLWVAKKTLDTGRAARKWSESATSPGNSRLLELADIALGLKKPDSSFRKRRSGVPGSKP